MKMYNIESCKLMGWLDLEKCLCLVKVSQIILSLLHHRLRRPHHRRVPGFHVVDFAQS